MRRGPRSSEEKEAPARVQREPWWAQMELGPQTNMARASVVPKRRRPLREGERDPRESQSHGGRGGSDAENTYAPMRWLGGGGILKQRTPPRRCNGNLTGHGANEARH